MSAEEKQKAPRQTGLIVVLDADVFDRVKVDMIKAKAQTLEEATSIALKTGQRCYTAVLKDEVQVEEVTRKVRRTKRMG
jgi:hypothetical protein